MRVRNKQDFWAGLMFLGLGVFFAAFGSQYDMGTSSKMGPGFFPYWLGMILAVLGGVIVALSLRLKAEETHVGRFDLRVMGLVLGAVVVFGIALRPLGLPVALLLLIVIASLASHEFKWRPTIVTAILLILLCMGLFVYGLKLIFPLTPFFLAR